MMTGKHDISKDMYMYVCPVKMACAILESHMGAVIHFSKIMGRQFNYTLNQSHRKHKFKVISPSYITKSIHIPICILVFIIPCE